MNSNKNLDHLNTKCVSLENAPIDIIDGDRGNNYPNSSEFFDNEYCLFLNSKNVTSDGFSFDKKMFITKEKDKLLRKGKLNRGDVILTTRGTLGNVAFYDGNVEFENIRINSGMVILRSKDETVDNNFLYWIMRSDFVQKQIIRLKSGTAQPQIPISSLKHIDLIFPNIGTQRKISYIISIINDKIELNNKINKNLEEIIEATFKRWFIDFEPFKNNDFQDSFMGKIPSSWKVIDFKDILDIRTEKSNNQKVTKFSVTNDGIYPRDEKFKKKLASSSSKFKIIRENDLVFGMSREILNWGIMKEEIGGVSSAYNVFSISDEVCPNYLESFIKNRISYFKDIIKPASREGQGIDKNILFLKQIYIPPKDIINEYYQFETPISEIIKVNKIEISNLIKIRDLLLPKLMSGEIDVSNVKL
ncbi:MAG: restriction endonuclease subunit S [Methanobacteriaceae archaeon]